MEVNKEDKFRHLNMLLFCFQFIGLLLFPYLLLFDDITYNLNYNIVYISDEAWSPISPGTPCTSIPSRVLSSCSNNSSGRCLSTRCRTLLVQCPFLRRARTPRCVKRQRKKKRRITACWLSDPALAYFWGDFSCVGGFLPRWCYSHPSLPSSFSFSSPTT